MKKLLPTLCVLLVTLLLVLPVKAEEKKPLQIVQQPTDCAVAQGECASTTLVAEGEGLRYQWYLANADMNDYGKSSLTGPEYYVTMKGEIHNRKIYCVVTDKYGNSVQSDTVTLTMSVENEDFAFLMHPYAETVKAGEQSRAELMAEGENLRYQWYFANVDMNYFAKSSLTGSEYHVTMKGKIHNRRVYCLVTDRYGRTFRSEEAVLTMDVPEGDPVQILQQPTVVSAYNGTKVQTGVLAQGEDLKYQWYLSNVGMIGFGKSSLTGPNYYVTMKDHIHNRQIYCVITDAYGRSVRTETVTLNKQDSGNSHVHDFFEDEVFASCMSDAYNSYFCECGEYYILTKPNTKRPHEFSEYMDNWDATCYQNGTETAYCGCGATRTREIPDSKLDHTFWAYHGNDDATCTANGTETAKCEYCDATDTHEIPGSKLSHSFTQYHSDNNATCEADGTETAKCDNCDAADVRNVPGTKLSHSFTLYHSDNNATCKADGTETAKCDNCDATDTRTMPGTKLPHIYDSGSCVGCGDTPVGVKITSQPKNTTVVAGLSGKVTITATGDGLTYEWYYKDVGSDSFVKATATGNSYTITMIDSADGRQAYCIVRDKYGNSVQSNTVKFTKKSTTSGDGATDEDGDIFIPFN